jgi:hypothetical protein
MTPLYTTLAREYNMVIFCPSELRGFEKSVISRKEVYVHHKGETEWIPLQREKRWESWLFSSDPQDQEKQQWKDT